MNLKMVLPVLKETISYYTEMCIVATDIGCVKHCLQYDQTELRNCVSHLEFSLGLHLKHRKTHEEQRLTFQHVGDLLTFDERIQCV